MIVDREKIKQVILNLCKNAVEAMPKGGSLTVKATGSEGGVIVEVTDTGVGMTEETQSHLFEPFFTTKGDKGTGLGLSTVFGIVQRHDGRIEIESEVGRGSIFRIRFPRGDQQGQREAPPSVRSWP